MWTRGLCLGFIILIQEKVTVFIYFFSIYLLLLSFFFFFEFWISPGHHFCQLITFICWVFFYQWSLWLFIIVNIFIIYLLIHFIILNINQRKQVIILSIWNKMSTFNKCEMRTFCTEIVDICTKLSYNNSCLHLKCLYPYI